MAGDRAVLRQDDYYVRMADVDAARVIYYASPLRWMETLIGDWYRDLGHSLSDQLTGSENCPCVDVHLSYRRPVRLDDRLALALQVERIGRSSFALLMTASDDAGRVAVEVHTIYASVAIAADGSVRSAPLPEWLRAGLGEPGPPGAPDRRE